MEAAFGFMHDMSRPNHVIGTKARVCPKDRGAVAVNGKLQYGLYFIDCPLGYIHGKPEYQGALILARKQRSGSWKPLTAGTSPFGAGLKPDYFGAPKAVVTELERLISSPIS